MSFVRADCHTSFKIRFVVLSFIKEKKKRMLLICNVIVINTIVISDIIFDYVLFLLTKKE